MLYAALKRRSSTVLRAGGVEDGRTALRAVFGSEDMRSLRG
jgi:hypothetical protein